MKMKSFVRSSLSFVPLLALACARPTPDGVGPDPNSAATPPTATTVAAPPAAPLHWSRFPILGGPPCAFCDPSKTKVDCPPGAGDDGACDTEGKSCTLRCDPTSCPVHVTCVASTPS
jgi:hypothetical protein